MQKAQWYCSKSITDKTSPTQRICKSSKPCKLMKHLLYNTIIQYYKFFIGIKTYYNVFAQKRHSKYIYYIHVLTSLKDA